MSKIWTHAEAEETKEKWKHPDISIHTNNRNMDNEHWQKFVARENLFDGLWIAVIVLGLLFLLGYVISDLMNKYGVAVPMSIAVVFLLVLVFSRKQHSSSEEK